MPRKVNVIAQLVAESPDLAEAGRSVQGDRELLTTEEQIDELVERYHAWFAHPLNVVHGESRDRFRAEFKQYLAHEEIRALPPVARRGQHVRPELAGWRALALPYWANQYDTAFHGPLLAQRRILAEAQQALLGAGHGENIELVERVCAASRNPSTPSPTDSGGGRRS